MAEILGWQESIQDERAREEAKMLCVGYVSVSVGRRTPCRASEGVYRHRCLFAIQKNERF